MIYALGLHEEIGNKNIKSGIISLKNMKDGVLEGKCAGETEFSEDNLNLYKKEIFGLIDDILNKDILIEDCYWGFLMIEHTYYSFKDLSFLELVPPYITTYIAPYCGNLLYDIV